MILRRITNTLLQFVALATVVHSMESRWSVLSWMSSNVCALIIFPASTQQWSLLGLNLWSSQTVEKPHDRFDLNKNPISRVLNFFPIPVEEECLSQDKRRRGVCMNTYECRIQRGKSHGPCALGFGVCCILYVDVDADDEPLTLDIKLPNRLQSRMWEIRIVQLAFEQRAPTGCLQYFQGNNGTLKTLNYLSNGRFLADQDYLLCIRQEKGMCGISYTPCTSDSFRIGPPRMQIIDSNNTNANASSVAENTAGNTVAQNTSDNASSVNDVDADIEGSGADPANQEAAGASMNATNLMEQEAEAAATSYGQERCRNRVLIPCDFEEFITPGNNEAGICNLEHCGNSLCDQNELDEEGKCRVETWATPFRIRVAFGPGQDTGTTLEDNIGMCLMYEQLLCVS
ncbi:uncharacterized protein LOC116428623 isoform X4 [Nomia melanderi]|uniref:uncharacterized protein LOC116428623 isoform X4 n=1 Tax=Nomia melanderi TaxID=2448451 RepID=UPI003FCEACC7